MNNLPLLSNIIMVVGYTLFIIYVAYTTGVENTKDKYGIDSDEKE